MLTAVEKLLRILEVFISKFSNMQIKSLAPAGFWFGETLYGVGLYGGQGAEPPPGHWRIFGNLQKDFVRKLQKLHYFSIFFKKFKNQSLLFRALGRKIPIVGKVLKIFDDISIEKFNF